MSEELKQAISALQCAKRGHCDHAMADEAIAALEALTQRPAAQTEREAFEAWARPNGYDLRRNDVLGHYSSIDTSRAWSGFRAGRASLPAHQQATPDQFADASKMVSPVALRSVHLTRDTAGMCVVRVNGRVAIRDNGDIIDHMATLEWFADTQQATPAPVGEPRQFPVLNGKTLFSVPWSMLVPHERQARANHGQSLERLADRGGLSPVEMVAVVLGKRWRDVEGMSAADAEASLSKIVTAQTRPAPGVPEGFDVQALTATGGGHKYPLIVVRDKSSQLGEDVFPDEHPVIYGLLSAWLAAAQAKGADK